MISSFIGKNSFLSNFYGCSIDLDGLQYKSAEAAFQAQKTLDPVVRKTIASMEAKQARQAGRQLIMRKDIDWNEYKIHIMYSIVKLKFVQHPELAEQLLATKSEYLVEGNTWGDRFWGVCDGEGQNFLGKILMLVRDELRKGNVKVAVCNDQQITDNATEATAPVNAEVMNDTPTAEVTNEVKNMDVFTNAKAGSKLQEFKNAAPDEYVWLERNYNRLTVEELAGIIKAFKEVIAANSMSKLYSRVHSDIADNCQVHSKKELAKVIAQFVRITEAIGDDSILEGVLHHI